MKVIIVGSDEVWALENAYIKVFQSNCEVKLYNAHGIFLEYYQKGISNKLKYRLGVSSILKRINNELIQQIDAFAPDAIFIFKGMEVFPSTLEYAKDRGITLVNYNGDHPFQHFSKGSGNKNVLEGIRHYTMHFSYSLAIIKEIEARYKIPCKWLPFGYYKAIEPNLEKVLENKICFIGNPDEERLRTIKVLIEAGFSVDVYGSNWDKEELNEDDSLRLHPLLFKDDFNTKAQEYKIQLNIFRPHNKGSHNMRTFEMPALGSIMVAPRSEEHLKFFKEGEEAFYFNDDKELIEQCRQILDLPKKEIDRIRINAYQRSIKSGYSYNDRALFAFAEIQKQVEEG